MKTGLLRRALRSALVTMAMLAPISGMAQQQYPTMPIRIIIGFPPGTILDTVSRLVTTEMEKSLGKPFIIEFKPGANGTIAAQYVANSTPDGHTLFYGNILLCHPLFNANNGIDASKAMSPVSRFVTLPYFLVTRASLPAKSFTELVAYSKPDPDRATYGAPTATTDLLMQMLRSKTGLAARSIPYKSSAQMVTALIAGEIDMTITSVQALLPHIASGNMRAVLVTSVRKSPVLPSATTLGDIDQPSLEVALNFGLWAPPGTSAAITRRLASEAAKVLKTDAIMEKIRTGSAAESVGSTPEEQMRSFNQEVAYWSEAAKLANFKPQ